MRDLRELEKAQWKAQIISEAIWTLRTLGSAWLPTERDIKYAYIGTLAASVNKTIEDLIIDLEKEKENDDAQ